MGFKDDFQLKNKLGTFSLSVNFLMFFSYLFQFWKKGRFQHSVTIRIQICPLPSQTLCSIKTPETVPINPDMKAKTSGLQHYRKVMWAISRMDKQIIITMVNLTPKTSLSLGGIRITCCFPREPLRAILRVNAFLSARAQAKHKNFSRLSKTADTVCRGSFGKTVRGRLFCGRNIRDIP